MIEELIAQRSASMIDSAVHMAEMKDIGERQAPQNERERKWKNERGWGLG